MNFKSILIITYGRSGSTLLQGLLNSIDCCLIRGENSNFCYYLFKAYQSIGLAQSQNGETPQSPWFGSQFFNDRLFISQCKLIVYKFLLGDHYLDNEKINCYGFKEIRYSSNHISNDFENYLKFLSKLFPNVAFIFNTRDLNDVADSGWWKIQQKEEVIQHIKELEITFYSYMTKFPDNTFHITYEDIILKSEKLKELYRFLGAAYEEGKVNDILSKPHSYTLNKK